VQRLWEAGLWDVCCGVEHEALLAVCDQWKEFEAVVVREGNVQV
jgi:hypothetical protein